MASAETRVGGVELRALPDQRRLTGIAMPYGSVSESYRERFMPGALVPAPRGLVHVRHDRSRPISGWPGQVELRDTPEGLEAVVEVDDTEVGDAFLTEARAGRFGWSVEFNRAKFKMIGGVREISSAVLIGLGVTPFPSYPGTGVELRQARPRIWIT